MPDGGVYGTAVVSHGRPSYLSPVNLSIGGMFIATPEPRPVGVLVYLQFRVADGGTLIEGLGRVVHVNDPATQEPGMGIEFVNLDEGSRDFIDAAIHARLERATA